MKFIARLKAQKDSVINHLKFTRSTWNSVCSPETGLISRKCMHRQSRQWSIKDKNISHVELDTPQKNCRISKWRTACWCIKSDHVHFVVLLTELQNNSGQKGPQEVSWPSLQLTAGSAVRSNEAVQGFIQLGLEKLQWWRLHRLCAERLLYLWWTLWAVMSSQPSYIILKNSSLPKVYLCILKIQYITQCTNLYTEMYAFSTE